MLREIPDLYVLPNLEPVYVNDTLAQGERVRFLILYGSLRERSFSRFAAEEIGRLLTHFGAEVRLFDPRDLPLPDAVYGDDHPAVHELRRHVLWADGQVWCSPERHGQMSAIMKNQIDHLPLEMRGIRPTQGQTLALMQVCGGSQSFNALSNMRIIGRWMRMFCIPNQSSIPKAFEQFDQQGRMLPSSFYDRIVDVAEELVRVTRLLKAHRETLSNRYSERREAQQPFDQALDLCAIALAP